MHAQTWRWNGVQNMQFAEHLQKNTKEHKHGGVMLTLSCLSSMLVNAKHSLTMSQVCRPRSLVCLFVCFCINMFRLLQNGYRLFQFFQVVNSNMNLKLAPV
jgi:hypothetical protein